MSTHPRAAFLPDTFHEVNGVAHTARQLEAFARRRQIPFLSVHCGQITEKRSDGAVTILQLKRGPLSIGLDANLDYDPLLMVYSGRVLNAVKDFGADLIHITGPGDMGAVGAYVSWRLKLPLVISWHTSLHEYAGTRLQRLLSFAGKGISDRAGKLAEKLSLQILRSFYRRAIVTMAPNEELLDLTRRLTGRPAFLMRRGIDTQLFTPARRKRHNDRFRIGYVGRLTPEKNVRFLAELGNALRALGWEHFEFLIVGEGSEEDWLRKNVPNVILTGVLRGQSLAEAYADMDLFAFPSRTDTFGNVVLEALASGVPAVVTSVGGPKFLVKSGVTGHVASSDWDFIDFVNNMMTNAKLHQEMCLAAVRSASLQSWDEVFESVFQAYREGVELHAEAYPKAVPLLSSRVHGRGGS